MTAVFLADAASYAAFGIDHRLRRRVQLKLASDACGAHSEIFQRTAEACLLMSLEMVHGDDDVSVCYGSPDFRGLAIFPVEGDFPVVCPLEPVRDDYIGMGGNRIETVVHGCMEMVHGVGPASGIESVAVREEHLASETSYQVDEPGGIVRPDVGEVAGFSEMYLYRSEFVPERNVFDPGPLHEAYQLCHQIVARSSPEIGEIYFAFH